MSTAMEILASRVLITPRVHAVTLDFYQRVLGLPIYREFGGEPPRGVVFFLGGGFLEVSGEGEARGTEATALWLQVRDVEAAHEHLVDHGVRIEEAPTAKPWGLRELRVRDPDARLLVLVEVPPGHPLRTDRRSLG